jgi:7-cyano-7-deazaguanine synthase
MSKKLLMFSGGPDSTAAAYLLKDQSDLHLISLADEVKAKNVGELKAAQKIAAMLALPYKVVDISGLNALLDGLPNILISLGTGGEKKADFVHGEDGAPLSSQLLHTLCALHGIANGYESMIWGVHNDDNRIAGDGWLAEYARHFNGLLSHSGFSFRLETPFLEWSKADLLFEGSRLGAPIHLTFSCITPEAEAHCGKCAGCEERSKAMAEIERRSRKAA